MDRFIDLRDSDRERSGLSRGGSTNQGAGDDSDDVFSRGLTLPRGPERELVRSIDSEYRLRGSDVRALTTVGAFRVVDVQELERQAAAPQRARMDIRHLRSQGLVDVVPYVHDRERRTLATLTKSGLRLLESARRDSGDDGARQHFYAGLANRRELSHDSRIYQAYLRTAERVQEDGGRIRRVVLENQMKSEYQGFLQDGNRARPDSSGRPNRDEDEIAAWARDHRLPTEEGHVQFPDLRIEYEGRDGRDEVRDVEIVTPHYRGAHAAAKAQSGFTRYRSTGARVGGGRGGRIGGGHGKARGGSIRESRLAEEMLK